MVPCHFCLYALAHLQFSICSTPMRGQVHTHRHMRAHSKGARVGKYVASTNWKAAKNSVFISVCRCHSHLCSRRTELSMSIWKISWDSLLDCRAGQRSASRAKDSIFWRLDTILQRTKKKMNVEKISIETTSHDDMAY